MLELLQFPPAFGLMNPSPFCMKVEVFLRLGKLPFRCVNNASPVRAPKGKLPLLRDGTVLIADSQAIVEHLQQQHAASLAAPLRRSESARELLLRRLLEEHLYFAMLWLRWVDAAGWAKVGPAFFGGLPAPARALVSGLVRRKIKRDLHGQGMGRHSRLEIETRACKDLDACAATLGQQPYFHGAQAGAIDACAYAFLANVLWAPIESPVREHASALAPLVAYCERLRERVGQA